MQRHRTLLLFVAAAGLPVLAAGVAARPAYRLYQIREARQLLQRSDDQSVRLALRDLAPLRAGAADQLLLRALADPRPATRHAAATAIFRAKRRDLAVAVLEAAQREPVDRVRCDMIYHWGQLAGDEQALRAMLLADDAWAALAAAKALLRLGHLDVAATLLAFAGGPDLARRRDAQQDLLALAAPMASMIGQYPDVLDVPRGDWSAKQLRGFAAWWGRHVTPRLLRDYVTWRSDKPENWKRARRLQHEWHKYASGFLRMGEPADDAAAD